MFFVYILESLKTGRFYIGQTSGLKSRVKRHNDGRNISTKTDRPWQLIYWEEFETRSEAYKTEQMLKRFKKREAIIEYINKNNSRGIAQPG